MQYKIYRNINTNFTFENIYPYMDKYWTNEVINKKNKYKKILLTLIVFTENNKKYKLINGILFNTNIRYILIHIEQNLNKIPLCNRKNILHIIIKHRFDKNTYITPKPSIFYYFKLWLFSYTNTEIRLANDIFHYIYSYNLLKKYIYNSYNKKRKY